MSKQTAVEWLRDEIQSKYDKSFIEFYRAEITQALAMEREQKKQDIHNYFEWHKSKGYVSHQQIDIKEYLEETYGKEATNANG